MAYIIGRAVDEFNRIGILRDARAVSLPFTSFTSMTSITTCYLGILHFVPKYMANRPAYTLRVPILAYNFVQILLNSYLLINSVYELAVHPLPYQFFCAAPNTLDVYYSNLEFTSVYMYHVFKVIDLLDTVFFVLRKKNNQVTFLHVYHHVAVMWGTCLITNFVPGGHFVFLGLINCFVHGVMYAYYFASLYNPQIKNSIGIKQIVTLIQMTQFVALILHSAIPLFWNSPCGVHQSLLMLSSTQNVFMLCMFSEFYWRTYIVGHSPKVKAKLPDRGK